MTHRDRARQICIPWVNTLSFESFPKTKLVWPCSEWSNKFHCLALQQLCFFTLPFRRRLGSCQEFRAGISTAPLASCKFTSRHYAPFFCGVHVSGLKWHERRSLYWYSYYSASVHFKWQGLSAPIKDDYDIPLLPGYSLWKTMCIIFPGKTSRKHLCHSVTEVNNWGIVCLINQWWCISRQSVSCYPFLCSLFWRTTVWQRNAAYQCTAKEDEHWLCMYAR